MNSRREIIIKDTFSYTVSNYIVTFIGFFNSTFIKRFLGPIYSGYWALLVVIQSYMGHLCLGTKAALGREIPQSIGRGQRERAEYLQNATFSFLLIVSVVGTIIVVPFSLFVFDTVELKVACLLLGILIGLSHMYTLVITVLRAKKQFSLVSRVIVMDSIFSIIFALSLTYFFGLIGLVIGLSIENIVSFFLAKRWAKINFHFSLDWKVIKDLVVVGIPMLGAGVLFTTFINIDKMMIGKFISVESVGFYSIAVMAARQLETIPKFFNIVIFPHIQEDYGASGNISSSKTLILKSIYFTSRFLPFALGGIMFFMNLLVYWLLPKFIPGLGAMRILLFGFFFVVLSEIFPSVIYTVNKQIYLTPIYVLAIVISIILNYVFIKLGWGIEGVALGTSISHFIFFIIISIYASRYLMDKKSLFKTYFFIFLYFCYFLIGINLISRIDIFYNKLLSFSIQILMLFIISIPVFVQIQRRERFFSSILGVLRESVKGKI